MLTDYTELALTRVFCFQTSRSVDSRVIPGWSLTNCSLSGAVWGLETRCGGQVHAKGEDRWGKAESLKINKSLEDDTALLSEVSIA